MTLVDITYRMTTERARTWTSVQPEVTAVNTHASTRTAGTRAGAAKVSRLPSRTEPDVTAQVG